MASTSSQNKKSRPTHSVCETTERDEISNLPEYVLDEILSRLSIRDLVRTTVLSTKWRYKWASVPSLVIDCHDQVIEHFDRVINHVMLLHMGPVHKFKLFCKDEEKIPFDELDEWILYLSKHSIKELVLHIQDSVFELYWTPMSVFSCQGLTHLDLSWLFVYLPSEFDGFPNLKSLTLDGVEMSERDLDELIFRSPVLERLTLSDLPGDKLNIHGPNLLFFDIKGHFVDVRFKSAPRLTELCINAEFDVTTLELNTPGAFGELRELMASIPQISRLTFGGCLMDYLAAGKIARELTAPCTNLTLLSIDVAFYRFKDVCALLSLLRSASNLEELRVGCQLGEPWLDGEVSETSINDWVWDCISLDRLVTRIKLIKIHDFVGTKDEWDFVKFMVLASPAIECMTIELKNILFVIRYEKGKFELLKKC